MDGGEVRECVLSNALRTIPSVVFRSPKTVHSNECADHFSGKGHAFKKGRALLYFPVHFALTRVLAE